MLNKNMNENWNFGHLFDIDIDLPFWAVRNCSVHLEIKDKEREPRRCGKPEQKLFHISLITQRTRMIPDWKRLCQGGPAVQEAGHQAGPRNNSCVHSP